MSFVKTITEKTDKKLTIVIKKTSNTDVAVSIVPEIEGVDGLAPIIVSGNINEIDNAIISALSDAMSKMETSIRNIDMFEKSVKDAEAKKKEQATKSSKQTPKKPTPTPPASESRFDDDENDLDEPEEEETEPAEKPKEIAKPEQTALF